MKIEVLIATMNQNDYELPNKMNIQSDAIISNQCDRNSIESFAYKGHSIKYLNFKETGVGLNRNNALMRASADICLFADDDVVYYDGYSELVENAFDEIPDADLIIFNLVGRDSGRDKTLHVKRIRYFNFLKYGTARVAIKLKPIRENGIMFNLCFGGGTEHSHGEDNLFLHDCLKKGLKIYAVPYYLGYLNDERQSTWNDGYGKKYLEDQGVLYKTMSRKWWKLLCLQDAIRHHKRTGFTWKKAYKIMISL